MTWTTRLCEHHPLARFESMALTDSRQRRGQDNDLDLTHWLILSQWHLVTPESGWLDHQEVRKCVAWKRPSCSVINYKHYTSIAGRHLTKRKPVLEQA